MTDRTELEANLSRAQAEVDAWQARVGKITSAGDRADQTAKSCEDRRRKFALSAAFDDAEAKSALDQLDQEQRAAERFAKDMQLALPEANQGLASAQQALQSCKNQLGTFDAIKLAGQRVVLAARIDGILSDLAEALGEYDRMGTDLLRLSSPTIGQSELINDRRRFMDALPVILLKTFRLSPPSMPMSMAQAEAGFLGVTAPVSDAPAATATAA